MKTYVTLNTLLLGILWLSASHGDPYQCTNLKRVIPSGCRCTGALKNNVINDTLVVIDCRKQNYSQMPAIKGTSNDVIYELTMADNNLTSIPATAFQGLKIQRLDLRNNPLRSFSQTAFTGLENDLLELFLSADAAVSLAVPTSSLKNLINLNTLILEYFRFKDDDLNLGVLDTLTFLKSLTLRYNNLFSIHELGLPARLTYLELDHQALGPSLPIDSLRSLTELETLAIRNTDINILSNSAFLHNTKLQTLQLAYNKIANLENGCFNGIYNLQKLSLHENGITNTSILDPIRNLTALRVLDVSETGISSIPTGAKFLQNKPSLSSLVFESNQLTLLTANIFANLGGSLTAVSLANNSISQLDNTAFQGLTGLQSLDLSRQRISRNLSLPSTLPMLAPGLQQLLLSGTPVDPTFLWQIVQSLTLLQVLKLDGIRVGSVPDYALAKLTQLRELHLNVTNISEITQKAFAGPRNLKTLYLDNNRITTISNCAFYQYSTDQPLQLSLAGNSLNCDCTLNWLLKAIAENVIVISQSETCSIPADKANKLLSSFKPGNFTCSFTNHKDPQCLELYTTTTTSSPATVNTSPGANPSLNVSVVDRSNVSIQIRWVITDSPNLSYFQVKTTEQELSATKVSGQIPKTQNDYLISALLPGHTYSICVYAFNTMNDSKHGCLVAQTSKGGISGPNVSPDNSHEIGIIVGACVAGVLLLAILAAIIYFVFLRRADSKHTPQPHVFSPSELPTAGGDSKSFTRAKGKQYRVGRALQGSANVNTISGASVPDSARIYQNQDETSMSKSPTNIVECRPEPYGPASKANGDFPQSYINMGYSRDSNSS